MLDEIEKVVEPVKAAPEEPEEEQYYPEVLCELGLHLSEGVREAKFMFRNKSLVIKGIQGDFKVLLEGQLVCECVYGSIYNANKDLVKELLS